MFNNISPLLIQRAWILLQTSQTSNYSFDISDDNQTIIAFIEIIEKNDIYTPDLLIERKSQFIFNCHCDDGKNHIVCVHGIALLLYIIETEPIFRMIFQHILQSDNPDEFDHSNDYYYDYFDQFDKHNDYEQKFPSLNLLKDQYKDKFIEFIDIYDLSKKELKELAKKHQLKLKNGHLDSMYQEFVEKLWEKIEAGTILDPLPIEAKHLLSISIIFNYLFRPPLTEDEWESIWTDQLGFSGSVTDSLALLADLYFLYKEDNTYHLELLIDPTLFPPLPLKFDYLPASFLTKGKKIEAPNKNILADLLILGQHLLQQKPFFLFENEIDLINDSDLWPIHKNAPTKENYYELPIPKQIFKDQTYLNDQFDSPHYLSHLLFILDSLNIINFFNDLFTEIEPSTLSINEENWHAFLHLTTAEQLHHIKNYANSRKNYLPLIYLTQESDYCFARKYVVNTQFVGFLNEYEFIYHTCYLLLQNLAKNNKPDHWITLSSFLELAKHALESGNYLFEQNIWSLAPKDNLSQLLPQDLRNKKIIESFFYAPFFHANLLNLCELSGQLYAFQITDIGFDILNKPIINEDFSASVPLIKPATVEWIDDNKIELKGGANFSALSQFISNFFVPTTNINQYELNKDQFISFFNQGGELKTLMKQFAQQNLPMPKDLKQELTKWQNQFGQLHLYEQLTIIQLSDEFALEELRTIPLFKKALIHQFSPQVVAIDPLYLEELIPLLQKKNHTPRLIIGATE